MCETFKWVKLLVVKLQKNGLQIPVKISLGKINDCERRKSFSKYVIKNANICPSVVKYRGQDVRNIDNNNNNNNNNADDDNNDNNIRFIKR